ncbi:MAG: tetratricopeptide repeat protein [Myxococcota bacterium]
MSKLPLIALLSVLGTAWAASAYDAGGQAPVDLEAVRKDRSATSKKHQLAPRISRYLAAAAKAADEGSTEEGQALLDKLNPKRLNPLERVYVYRLKGFLAYADGEYQQAIENFERVLEEEALPLDAENKIRFNIGQIHASLQEWPETVAALQRWFRYVDEPDPLAHYLMGIAYYQMGEFDKAIESTESAVELAPEPKEAWLQLLAALHVQKEDYVNATPFLEELVTRFPKKQYWVQLSLIYGALDNYKRSLAVQQVAYLQGLLTEDRELRRLARSYLYHDMPYPAAKVLQKGIDDEAIDADAKLYELLANSLIAAREFDRSLPPLKKAAELSENGNLFVRLGQVHLQREEWAEAAVHLRRAIDKGGLEDPGNAQLLLGISQYNNGRVSQARASFWRASKHAKTRQAATNWITHIDSEANTG